MPKINNAGDAAAAGADATLGGPMTCATCRLVDASTDDGPCVSCPQPSVKYVNWVGFDAAERNGGDQTVVACGGKLGGLSSYYHVAVKRPMSADSESYVAECGDIIEALNMTFNEGEAFKAIWRLAAARQGRVKAGSAGMVYDADKVAHYGARVAAHTLAMLGSGK